MYRFLKYGIVAALGLAIASGSAPVVSTAQAQGMYDGKQVTLLIGYGFGGTYGKYARLMSKHLPNHIAGKPNIIVQSMPGAGGLKAANYAYSVMPKQGFHIIRVVDRTTAGVKPFVKAQVEIRKKLKQEKIDKEIKEYLAGLRKDTRVWTIFDEKPGGAPK